MNPAEQVRVLLAAERRRGVGFDTAWRRSLPVALGPPPQGSRALLREWEGWRRALRAARGAFWRAYRGAAPTRGERAVVAMLTALAEPEDRAAPGSRLVA